MAGAGFVKPANQDLIQQARSADEALAVIAATEPVPPEKWITAEER